MIAPNLGRDGKADSRINKPGSESGQDGCADAEHHAGHLRRPEPLRFEHDPGDEEKPNEIKGPVYCTESDDARFTEGGGTY